MENLTCLGHTSQSTGCFVVDTAKDQALAPKTIFLRTSQAPRVFIGRGGAGRGGGGWGGCYVLGGSNVDCFSGVVDQSATM